MKKTIAVALAAVSVVGAGWAFRHVVDPYEKVYRIADGDTFILENNKQTVRLFGLDAPELDQCYGKESFQKLDQLLVKRKVQLKEPLVDHFGRVVALVYVDGKLINEIMIRQGFAAYRSDPGSGKEIMKAAHEYAKSRKLGIYSPACTDEIPPDPKCAIKGNHDLDREDYVYLLPDCSHYSAVIIRRFEGDRWFCTEKEAVKTGFTLSPDCK
jgi:endonuclease YncB( thermonuclease family)